MNTTKMSEEIKKDEGGTDKTREGGAHDGKRFEYDEECLDR